MEQFKSKLLLILFCLLTFNIQAENIKIRVRPDIVSYLQYKCKNYKTIQEGSYFKVFTENTELHIALSNNLVLLIKKDSVVTLKDLGNWKFQLKSSLPFGIIQSSKYIEKKEIEFKYNYKKFILETNL